MNSGAALFISGMVSSFKEGTEKSRQAVADGRAWTKMQELITAQGGSYD
jgi:anthranilate phosphoribosyltransferase